jgi:hypothetical protein
MGIEKVTVVWVLFSFYKHHNTIEMQIMFLQDSVTKLY